ncbi:uncharacterized protein LOC133791670 [Humulus lupulus]|uniref:uncharacterized protein LOC133791670 n=1 Tax=Humulus lupulus TaxID=3486 RepID=UPI002B413A38|nr:uncharacterized protein LOC133791670 [Humulus lupulus]
MLEQLKNNQNKETQVDTEDSLVITNPRHQDILSGQIYKDKSTLKSVLSYYAIKNHFQYMVQKSCSKEYSIVCLDRKCKWSLRASINGTTQEFIIRKYYWIYTCSLEIRFGDQHQTTSKLIGDCIKPNFLNIKTTTTPKDIRSDLNDRYGIKMNYMKAWRSREHALKNLRGKSKEPYSLLPSYLYMLQKTSSRSILEIKTGEDNSLLFLFMVLDASLKGWPKCKPIIVVDGTFLKATYGGTLLLVHKMLEVKNLHLHFVLKTWENDKSWEWFFKKLREAYGVREGQCLISNRHESIIKETKQVYPEITHGNCMFYLLSNLKTTYKKHAKKYREPLFGATTAYTVEF